MKTPIVFLHAFPLNGEMWQAQVDFFSKERECYHPSLPGFDGAKRDYESITFEYYVDYLITFLEKNKLSKAYWCGLSMGGYLALRLFERAPELCAGLILCDTKAGSDNNEGKLKRWQGVKTVQENREKFELDMWGALIGESSQKDLNIKTKFNSLIKNIPTNAICSGLVAMATRTDSTEMLKNISVPTLILVGDEDKVTPVSEATLMQKNIKNSKLVILEKTGHLSNLEKPNEFSKHLQNFLD